MNIWDVLQATDEKVTLFINSFNSPFTDYIWQMFSNKYIWIVLYLAVLIMFFKRLGWKKALVAFLSVVLTIVFCDQFANFTKATAERLRPCYNLVMLEGGLHILEGKGNLYGFYSAHAANAIGFAVASLCCFRWDKTHSYKLYGWLICIWGFFVGISRVFVGKHFFGDVMVGFAVGVLAGWALPFIASRILRAAKCVDAPLPDSDSRG